MRAPRLDGRYDREKFSNASSSSVTESSSPSQFRRLAAWKTGWAKHASASVKPTIRPATPPDVWGASATTIAPTRSSGCWAW